LVWRCPDIIEPLDYVEGPIRSGRRSLERI
jgi:hypothetical protein